MSDPDPKRLFMVRDPLAGFPEYALPEGFALRPYAPGDEAAWRRIHLEADLFTDVPSELFRAQFGHDEKELARRQLYLAAPEGVSVGTASAWYGTEDRWKGWGRVHWVAIVPRWQGRGLAKPLMSAVLARLAELGHDRAYLTTHAVRTPAIGLYARFGFRSFTQA